MDHTPFLIVISAPSGTGKTTICRRLIEIHKDLFYSVSATTRKKRPGEVDGVDYIFLDRRTFEKWKEEGELIEWALVYGEYYGTPKGPVIENIKKGRDVILDLDLEGKRALENIFPGRVVSIYLLPPDLKTLKERLMGRGVEEPSKLKVRLEKAREELRWATEYNYWVINDELSKAVERVNSIILAERMRRERVSSHYKLLDEISG
jgi:guanylate kinase